MLPATDAGPRPEILASAAALLRPDAAVSHECAALAHGLDVLRTPEVATLTTRYRLHAAARAGVVVRAAVIDEDEIGTWFGTRITLVARTVIDLARGGMRPGVVVADSALRNGLATLDELWAAIERQRRWDGVITARKVLHLASEKSESPLESLSRVFLFENDLPLPDQQVWIETYRGRYRVDGLWREQGVVLEVDGLVKYRDDPKARAKEKLRHEALARAGFAVERIVAEDLWRFRRETVRRLTAALTCSPGSPHRRPGSGRSGL